MVLKKYSRANSGNLESPICPGVHPPLPKTKVRFKFILNLSQPEVKRLRAVEVVFMRVKLLY